MFRADAFCSGWPWSPFYSESGLSGLRQGLTRLGRQGQGVRHCRGKRATLGATFAPTMPQLAPRTMPGKPVCRPPKK